MSLSFDFNEKKNDASYSFPMTPVLFGINTNDAGGIIIRKRTGKCSIFLSTNDGDKLNYNHEEIYI
jgi:hypothetical protein